MVAYKKVKQTSLLEMKTEMATNIRRKRNFSSPTRFGTCARMEEVNVSYIWWTTLRDVDISSFFSALLPSKATGTNFCIQYFFIPSFFLSLFRASTHPESPESFRSLLQVQQQVTPRGIWLPRNEPASVSERRQAEKCARLPASLGRPSRYRGCLLPLLLTGSVFFFLLFD